VTGTVGVAPKPRELVSRSRLVLKRMKE
jgi:hypothetical protein